MPLVPGSQGAHGLDAGPPAARGTGRASVRALRHRLARRATPTAPSAHY